jgi:FtsP/CotA-like multicopper oxidase with cupredoxin domain
MPAGIDAVPSLLSRRALIASGLGATLATACRRGVLAAPAARDETPLVILRAQPAAAPRRRPDEAAVQVAGYDGRIPGPTLACRRGGLVNVRLVNSLERPTSLHWHGVRVPNGMDGTVLTQASVASGATFDYRFVARDAGTYWYRPGGSENPLDRGLHGLLIVHEDKPPQVDRDVALLFADWPHAGGAGTAFATVNGLPGLDIPVKANERLRLRLVNAARARAFALRLDGHSPTVMAIDGQPAEPFVARDARVAIAPG